MREKIPKIVAWLVKKYGTNHPAELADYLNIEIVYMPLGKHVSGYYKYLKRRKYIFINADIEDDSFRRVVLAHELGHAIMHRTENCTFLSAHTLLLTSRIEMQANMFAAYLLIDDDMLNNFCDFTMKQFCQCTGFPKELINIRTKGGN